ncbi:MAG: NAD(P)-dependent oxidoreductase [Actinomycetota bacterium]
MAARRILITGASSFTGSWFARALAEAGHDVTATFRSRDYDGLRGERVRLVCEVATPLWETALGDVTGDWDVVCAHGAEAADYRSASFDADAAVAENTRGLGSLSAGRTVVTASVFEQGVQTPYAESKRRTTAAFRAAGAAVFVIPNPFGPWEEPRFTSYLARTWLEGGVAAVNTPDYVRDNIHVRALADAYVAFATGDAAHAAPSQYREPQGAFAQRFARELEPRLGVPCRVELHEQTDFSEPLELVNTDPVGGPEPWDELAAWYLR